MSHFYKNGDGASIDSKLTEVSSKVYDDNAGSVIEKVKRDLKYYIEEANHQIEECEDGIIVTGKAYGINSFKSWVRSYGASIIVLSPRNIVDEMIDSVMKKKALYGLMNKGDD